MVSLQSEVDSKNEMIDEFNNKLLVSIEAYDELKQAFANENNQMKELTATLQNVEAEKANVKEEMLLLLDQNTDLSFENQDIYLQQQQINTLRKDKANLQALVTEKDLQLGAVEESTQKKVKHLEDEINTKKSQINGTCFAP